MRPRFAAQSRPRRSEACRCRPAVEATRLRGCTSGAKHWPQTSSNRQWRTGQYRRSLMRIPGLLSTRSGKVNSLGVELLPGARRETGRSTPNGSTGGALDVEARSELTRGGSGQKLGLVMRRCPGAGGAGWRARPPFMAGIGGAGSGLGAQRSRGCIKPPGQRCVLGDHGLDLRSIAWVEVMAQGAQFALLGLDLGQPAGIGVCSVELRCRRFGTVGQKCAQNVLRDFQAQASGQLVWFQQSFLTGPVLAPIAPRQPRPTEADD